MSLYNIAVKFTGNASSLRSTLAAAGADVKTFTKDTDMAGKSAGEAGSLMKIGLAAGATVAAAALGYSIAKAMAFDTQMRNVQSITKESDASLHKMGNTLLNLSTQLPQSATNLAEGLYNIASSGFSGADGLLVLKASAEAAAAGLSTTETSARAITAVLHAYGLKASESSDVSDVLFQTVNLGVVSFDELAGAVGDVVGTAAAATVKIDEVGSAIATMTLAGISGAEASTSLNRVLTSILKPSDALGGSLRQLGYESGAQALKTDTLNVVMEKLRVLSGGNIETLQAWFPEIRSLRGALALMANDGKNYAKVVGEIQDKQARAGATAAALKEQMKSASAQITLLKNRVDAAAITLGVALLPVVIAAVHHLEDFGSVVGGDLMRGVTLLAPLWKSLAEVGANLSTVTKDLVDVLGPAAEGLAAIVGVPIIGALIALGKAIAVTTGFLAHHETIVKVLAVLYAGHFLAGLGGSAAAMSLLGKVSGPVADVLWALGVRLSALVGLWQTNTAASGLFVGSMRTLGSVVFSPTAAFAVLTVSLMGMVQAMQNADRKADALVKTLEKDVNWKEPESIRAGAAKIKAELADQMKEWHHYDGVKGVLSGVVQFLPTMEKKVVDNAAAVRKLTDAQRELLGQAAQLDDKYAVVARRLGVTTDQVAAFVQEGGKIDPLTSSYDDLTTAVQGTMDTALKGTPVQTTLSDAYKKVADATSDAKDQTDAFKSALDALFGVELTLFDAQTAAAKGMADFKQQLIDSRAAGLGIKDLFSTTSEEGRKNRDSISALVSKYEDLAKAMNNEGDTQGAVKQLQDLDGALRTLLASSGMSKQGIDDLLTSLGLVPGNYEAILSLQGKDTAKTSLDQLEAQLHGLGTGTKIPVQIFNMSGKTQNEIDLWLASVAASNPTAHAFVDGRPAFISHKYLKQALDAYGNDSATAKALLNYLDPTHKFQTLSDLLANYNLARATATATLEDQATGGIHAVQAQLDALNGRHVNASITVQYDARGKESITYMDSHGQLQHLAQGGITQAHVARKDLIHYGEPQTGGEAYVPRLGNRRRSKGILDVAAGWYGWSVVDASQHRANGGFGPASAGVSFPENDPRWDQYYNAGWRGDPTDGREMLYPPSGRTAAPQPMPSYPVSSVSTSNGGSPGTGGTAGGGHGGTAPIYYHTWYVSVTGDSENRKNQGRELINGAREQIRILGGKPDQVLGVQR
jgi:TP901 family phage tail tape measure protein